jgi:hypothetical protein
MAVFHRWHVVDVVGQRNGDDPTVAMVEDARKIKIEHIAIPAISGFGEQFGGGRL